MSDASEDSGYNSGPEYDPNHEFNSNIKCEFLNKPKRLKVI